MLKVDVERLLEVVEARICRVPCAHDDVTGAGASSMETDSPSTGTAGFTLLPPNPTAIAAAASRRLRPSTLRLEAEHLNGSPRPTSKQRNAIVPRTVEDCVKLLDRHEKALAALRNYERTTRGQLGETLMVLRELLMQLKTEEERDSIVGSLCFKMNKGDCWLLGPECAFTFKDIWRAAVVREPYMLEKPSSYFAEWKDRLVTAARRWITGEPLMLDLYIAQANGAELGVSTDEIAGNIYSVKLERNIIARQTVFWGSQKDVLLRVESPLRDVSFKTSLGDLFRALKKTVYGPGWIFQKFVRRQGGDQLEVLLQIDGDMYCQNLGKNETLRTDPRHVYAWDESVSYELVRFGKVADRLLMGSIPFQTEFKGPGRVWYSDLPFEAGYVGHLFTPSHWVWKAREMIGRALGYLNPANVLH